MTKKSDSLEIVPETEIWPYVKVVYAQHGIRIGERESQSYLGFSDAKADNVISARRKDLMIVSKKKKKKRKKRELAKLWNLPS